MACKNTCIYFFFFFCYSHYYFFFNDTATTEIYTLSLHDALPISDWQSGILPIRIEMSDQGETHDRSILCDASRRDTASGGAPVVSYRRSHPAARTSPQTPAPRTCHRSPFSRVAKFPYLPCGKPPIGPVPHTTREGSMSFGHTFVRANSVHDRFCRRQVRPMI